MAKRGKTDVKAITNGSATTVLVPDEDRPSMVNAAIESGLDLRRVVELLMQHGLSLTEQKEPKSLKGRMLNDATGVRALERYAKQEGVSVNRTALNNLVPAPGRLPTRNPMEKTFRSISAMLSLWVIHDHERPHLGRIKFSSDELFKIHSETYSHYLSDEVALRQEIIKGIDTLDLSSLRALKRFIKEGCGATGATVVDVAATLNRIYEQSGMKPSARLAMLVQSNISESGGKVPFALSIADKVGKSQDQEFQQFCIETLQGLLEDISLPADNDEDLYDFLDGLSKLCSPSSEADAFGDVASLLDYAGFSNT